MGALLVFAVMPSDGHGGYDEEIQRTDERIAAQPDHAENWFHRAYLNYLHGAWIFALRDLEKVDQLSPGTYPVDLLRGQAWMAGGNLVAARTALDEFIVSHPDASEGFLARARLMLRLKKCDAAVADFRQALNKSKFPEPDLYLETAEALISQGQLEEAVKQLQSGMDRLGEVPSLAGKALDLELSLGKYDAALSRVSTLQQHAARPEPWMAKGASILAQAGRIDESLTAWTELYHHLLALPHPERDSNAMSVLLEQSRNALEALNASKPTTARTPVSP